MSRSRLEIGSNYDKSIRNGKHATGPAPLSDEMGVDNEDGPPSNRHNSSAVREALRLNTGGYVDKATRRRETRKDKPLSRFD